MCCTCTTPLSLTWRPPTRGSFSDRNLEGESRRWIEHVQAGLRTLSATVNNVLHLHNTPQPDLAPTDAGQLLDWAYDFLLPLAKQARVEMQIIDPYAIG